MTHSLVQIRPRSLPAGLDPIGPLGFGTWRFTTDDLGAAHELVETALDVGMNLIDTADVYGLDYNGSGFGGNEELLGKVLAQAPGLRDRMVLATKGGIMPPIPYDSSDAYLRSAVEASLGRLGVEVIDLYQIHRPDMFAHPAQVAETLSSLVGEGKIRAVGVSNHTPAQHDALIAHLGDLPLATSQPEYSPAFLGPLRDGTFDLCMRDGIVPLAWSRLVAVVSCRARTFPCVDRHARRTRRARGRDRAAICYAFVLATRRHRSPCSVRKIPTGFVPQSPPSMSR